jgi:HEAT repeat protein
MAGLSIPHTIVADLLGLERPEEVSLLEKITRALEKVDPDLIPRLVDHPYADAIAAGVSAFDRLLSHFATVKGEDEQAAIADAIAEIIDREWATAPVVAWLQDVMASTKSAKVMSAAARAVALAGEEGFLEQQRRFLAGSPSEVRISAKLLGYGRHEKAVPDLLARLGADNMAVADVVIWALGEIGSDQALPKLHAMVEKGVEIERVVAALGRIGSRASVMRVLPVLLEGTKPQREAGAKAMAEIIRKSGGSLGDKDLTRSVSDVLEKMIDRDPSPKVRFWSMLAYANLGAHLEPNRILTALGGGLSDDEAGRVKKGLEKKPPAKGKKPKKIV